MTADPVVALVEHRSRLVAECENEIAGRDDDDTGRIVDRFDVQIARLDDEIACTVAMSAAGVIGQINVLRGIDLRDPPRDGDTADRLLATIKAGVEWLGRSAF